MKLIFVPLFALLSAGAALAQNAENQLDAPAAEADETAAPAVGRYQMTEAGNYQLMVDSATGRVWQVNRRGLEIALTPVMYEHEGDAKTPLPDHNPEPIAPVRKGPPQVSDEVAAERIAAAEEFVNDTVNPPIMAYTSELGEFPVNLASLQANVRRDPRWQGPYLRETIIDPWGNYYRYKYPGVKNPDTYDVWSLGPDGVESTDDIGNW